METQTVVAICVAGVLALFIIVNAIMTMIREGRESKINLATQQTATARAEADREAAVARGKEADATTESERTKQGEQKAAEREQLIRLGALEVQHASATVSTFPINKSGGV